MAFKLAWLLWLLAIVVSFAVIETYGFVKYGVPGTFSHFMANMAVEWRLWAFLWGLITGGLAVHFFWFSNLANGT